MRALIISLTTARQPQVLADVERLLEGGDTVTLIATKAAPWDDLPAGVALHTISEAERSHPVLRAERFLVLRLPRIVYLFTARVLSLVARLAPGKAGRKLTQLAGSHKKLWVRVRERTQVFHKERWGAFYGKVRPWVLWRTARRTILPGLPDTWDVIVVADSLSTPIGWQLARRHPTAAVGFSLDEALDGREPTR